MKTPVLLFVLLISISGKSQTYFTFLQQNNASGMISSSGYLFQNSFVGPGYEIPAGSGKQAIFDMNLWMLGVNENDEIMGSISKYSDPPELFPGPIATDYDDTSYTNTYGSCLYGMSKEIIYEHIANYNEVGYSMHPAISTWPANGNTGNGISSQLAPYHDTNGNGIYEPAMGEYPLIQGDVAIYVIMNDENGTHATGSDPIGVEVHLMMYQYVTADPINNTTFLNVQLYNRRNAALSDFVFGLYTDFELGNYADDFMGSDSARNMLYVYNGDDFDETGFDSYAYGANPPAVGLVSLSDNAGSARVITGSGIAGFPTDLPQTYNCLLGNFKNGLPVVNDGLSGTTSGPVTKFQYSGNPNGSGWSEQSAGNLPGDRAGILSSQPGSFLPGEKRCFNYAVVYSDLDTNSLVQAQELGNIADYVQAFYNYEAISCDGISLALKTNLPHESLAAYPNPTSGNLTIDIPSALVNKEISIQLINAVGQVVYAESSSDATQVILSMENFQPGIYCIRLSGDDQIFQQKIIKQ